MKRSTNQPLERGQRITGTFEVESGRTVFGELAIEGEQTSLYLRDDDFFLTLDLEQGYLAGTAHDLSRLSLHQCITQSGPGTGWRGPESYTFAELFPHYILHGSAHLRPDERCVAAISFSVEDGRAAFYDFDSYGLVLEPQKLIEKVANANRAVIKRKVVTGPNPQIRYFAGRTDLLDADTAIGTVLVKNRTGLSLPGAEAIVPGVGFEIVFEEPVTFEAAQDRATTLTRFLNLIIGRPQNRKDLVVKTAKEADPAPHFLRAYATLQDRWDHGPDRGPGPRDVLIEGVSNRREMQKVLQRWLALNPVRRDARLRFALGFEQRHRFSEDRLIGAANMFDLLPADAVPRRVRLTKNVLAARDQAKALFKALDDCPERQAILGALGRVGQSSLRQKIGHRAKIVTRRLPWLAPDMDLVIREAVNCRNHYVHGSAASFDYRGSGAFAFLTRALEFIFGASDLVDCGWNLRRFAANGGDHPFALLLQSWPNEVAAIKAEMAKGRA
ncbi:HEPN domain-containing protein [Sphingomonas sp. ASV193]|uniref:ApeA N-terminal domain 1-containing protein n=1 Tax=Sphingomonas sp. ASV193 TaxID=3144405 RepID=UPI0032E8BBE5